MTTWEMKKYKMPARVEKAVVTVLEHLWDAERADYESCPPEAQRIHIFCDLQILAAVVWWKGGGSDIE